MKTIGFFLLRILQITLSVMVTFFNVLVDVFTTQRSYNAKFGSIYLIGNYFNKGFVISRSCKLTQKASFSNLLITGVTGSGKSTKLLIPTLFTLRSCSMVINDVSGELFAITSGKLATQATILTLNFSNSAVSCGYNPLAYIRQLNDVNKVAHLLVATTLDKGSGDPFWSISVKSLLSIFIRLVLLQDEPLRNLCNVLYLIQVFSAFPSKIDGLISQSNDEKLILDYQSLIANSEKTLQGIVSSAKASLQIFESPEVAKVTSHNSIKFSDFRSRAVCLYLHNSISDQKFLACLISCFFEQFFSYMLERLPSKSDKNVFCLIDEASSTYIPLLPLACANGRKGRLGTIIAVQSRNQLKTMYKDEAVNICANCCTHVHLAGQTAIDELREIEALSGKCVSKDDKGVERVKPLITADEIRLLPEHRTIIVANNHPLIKGYVSPFWRNLIYRKYSKISPAPLIGDIPPGPVPLINV